MPASLTMTSGAELRYVAGLLRKAAARDLTRELRKGQRAAFRPLQKEIKAEAAATLPKRGGYNSVMARSVKVSVTTGTGRTALTARVYATGKVEQVGGHYFGRKSSRTGVKISTRITSSSSMVAPCST